MEKQAKTFLEFIDIFKPTVYIYYRTANVLAFNMATAGDVWTKTTQAQSNN